MGFFDRFRYPACTMPRASASLVDAVEDDALRLIDDGNEKEREGRLDEAMQRYQAALELVPKLARGHLNRGNILLKKGDTVGALSAFDSAIDCKPDYAAAHFNKGNVLHDQKKFEAAAASYRKALEFGPDLAVVHNNLGLVLLDLGQPEEALSCYQRALELAPDLVETHFNLASVLKGLGQIEQALASCRVVLKLKPDHVLAHFNLGNALQEIGQLDEAAAAFRNTVSLAPNFAEAHFNLGNALQDLKQFEAAAESYRRAITLRPGFVEALANLGNTLNSLGQPELALERFQEVLQIRPGSALAHFNVGLMQSRLGQVDTAIASFVCAVDADRGYVEAHMNLASALQATGRFNEAIVSLQAATTIASENAAAHFHLGNVLQVRGRFQEAAVSFTRAIELDPGWADAQCNLGHVLRELGHFEPAMACFCRALEIEPESALAHGNLAVCLQERGEHERAVAAFRKALAIQPDSDLEHTNLLFALTHTHNVDAQTLFSEHRAFGVRFESPLLAHWPKHRNSRERDRSLRVGFVSGDLRNHAVAHFVEPIFAQMSVSPSFVLHAYYNHPLEDDVSQRLRHHFDAWNQVSGLSDEALAQRIRDDEIDILIDLSGHTGRNRLLTFARKPAPLQASWIGYPATTGLLAMDYYLADPFFLPPGRFDDQFTEKLIYLPALAPFLPSASSPPVGPLPAAETGHLTFGSFNRLSKLSPQVVMLWSQLLRALPTARMLLGSMPREARDNPVIDWFAEAGISPERLLVYPRADLLSYLTLHHHVDICLDTLPYSGGTTTNHALWMGVPTLTLAGDTAPGRQGAANLAYVGLESFIAENEADFLSKGLAWAGDIPALSAVRAGLRARFAQSPLRRPETVSLGLQKALRQMWWRWCDGLSANSFSVD